MIFERTLKVGFLQTYGYYRGNMGGEQGKLGGYDLHVYNIMYKKTKSKYLLYTIGDYS